MNAKKHLGYTSKVVRREFPSANETHPSQQRVEQQKKHKSGLNALKQACQTQSLKSIVP